MPTEVIHQYFSARLDALRALEDRNSEELEAAATALKSISERYRHYHPSACIAGFSTALRCISLKRQWAESIKAAEPDADRFHRAAALHVSEHMKSIENTKRSPFDDIIVAIGEIDDPANLPELEEQLLSTPLPFGVKLPQRGITIGQGQKDEARSSPEIAFVKFEINGIAAKSIETLEPNVAHDISIHIRVQHWPKSAARLILEPVSLEPSDCYQLPTFEMPQPDELKGPYNTILSGRLILKMNQSLGAKPFEFKYRATFDPQERGQTVDLMGHRTLKLESVDPSRKAYSGYTNIDTKLYELRTQLRSLPGLTETDLRNVMQLLAGLGNVAGQALHGNLFPEGMNEAEFQSELKKMLRANPNIGNELEEHPSVGGGITDLSYRHIRLELKSERRSEITTKQLSKYADQTAQYVVASGRRVGVLCVLDSRKRTTPPAPAETLFSIQPKGVEHGGVAIVTIIVQGGLARPSDLSRRE